MTPAEITTLASALHLTSQPASQTVYAGQSAALTVTALGTEPLSYQWRKGGDAIAGATNASLAFAAVTLADAGAFDVVVTDSTGSVTSSIATLTVLSPNAAPSVAFATNNVGVLEDAGAQSVAGFASFSAGALSESNQVVTLASVTAANTALFSSQPAIAANGTLTFTSAANANGSSLVTVVVQDNGGTAGGGVDRATNTFTITVTAVNDAPSFVLSAGGTGAANTQVVAWGNNDFGQTDLPSGLGDVVAIAAGASHSLALRRDGAVVVWGAEFAAMGLSASVTGITAIAAGNGHSLTLHSDGTVSAWGHPSAVSQLPSGLTGITAIAAFDRYDSLALRGDGTVVAWGDNANGEATVPAGLVGVRAIAAGEYHSLALKSNGTVVAWGFSGRGATDVPAGLDGVVAIAAGGDHSLALKNDGTMVAWGGGFSGQFTVPAGLSGVVAIAAGYAHNLALRSDGTLVAWGDDSQGQSTVPVGLAGVTAISAAGYRSMALVRSLDITLSEDASAQTIPAKLVSIAAGPADEAGQVVSFAVTNSNNSLFSAQPAIGTNGTLTFTPAANAFGSATVTVIAQDNGGTANGGVDTSAAQTFTITVNAVNDAPSFALAGTNLTVFASDGAVARSAWATNISAGPANEAAQSVSFVVTNSDNTKFTVQPALAANGSLTFTPAANATGVVTVGVRAVDSGGTANGGVDTSAVQTFTVSLAASKVVLPAAFAAGVGDSISVPVSLLGAGIENGVAFTVTYPAAQLTYTGASAGGSSAGATVLANTSTAGQAGALDFRALGTTWSAGSNEVVFLHFTVAAGAGGATVPLAFADGVVTRQVSDVNAVDIAPVLYVDGTVQVAAPGVLEGDVSPRPTGSGTVTVTDAIQISRFAAGLDSVTNFGAGGEFQRADVAPRATLGDGRLTVADAIQAQRYAAGLDPATTAGGPTGLGGTAVAAVSAKLSAGARVVRVVGGQLVSGRANSVTVQVDAQGNEAGLSLSLAFDPGALTFVSAVAGQGASGGTVVVNAGRAASGRVGLVLMLPAGTSLAAGTRDVVTLTFNVIGSGATSISVAGDSPVAREVADVNANVLGASFVGGSFNIVLPAGLQAAGMERAADGSLRLVVRNADGTAITAAQAAKYVVHVTTNLGGAWTVLPNALVVENGALKIVDPAANGAGLRLYKLVETP